MEDCFLVTCREIKKTCLLAETIAHRATHVWSAIVAFIKIDMKLGCVQDFGVLWRNLSEVCHFKVLKDTCREKI